MPSSSRYSHHARRALLHAGLLATRFKHPRVDTGHLLVGLLYTRGSIGYSVLDVLGLETEPAAAQLENLTLPLGEALEDPPNDAALDIALDLAADESAWLGHHYIGTEHLLLGITRTNVGNASDLLRGVGIAPEQVRHRVRKALSAGYSEEGLQRARRTAQLSELSRRVINAAEQMAVALDHPTVGLGHLLLVLLRERRSPTAALLARLDLDEARVNTLVEAQQPDALVSIETLLEDALEHARNLGSHYTGTEHLLLALATQESGAALIERGGVAPAALREALEDSLHQRR
jgi:ATP-dependent Clp protease ATP-binding subunit ClpA